jgi:hypothetical protein
MAKYEQRYCPACARNVRAEKQSPSLLIHCLLTILTGGLWLPIFVLAFLASLASQYICPICGGRTEFIWFPK